MLFWNKKDKDKKKDNGMFAKSETKSTKDISISSTVKSTKSKKNVSDKIPNGRTFQTRDNFFLGQEHYIKPGYLKNHFYRKVVVVDSNRLNELAVVKLTTSSKGNNLPNYQKDKSNYKPYILTIDDDKKSINKNKKFIETKSKYDVSNHDIIKIKIDCLTNVKTSKLNKDRLRKLKNRK